MFGWGSFLGVVATTLIHFLSPYTPVLDPDEFRGIENLRKHRTSENVIDMTISLIRLGRLPLYEIAKRGGGIQVR